MGDFHDRRRPRRFDIRPPFIDERCHRYEEDWRAGRLPRIEDYVGGVDGEACVALWLELVLLDQELRTERGEQATFADYEKSCPDKMVWLELSSENLPPIEATGAAATGAGPESDPNRTELRPEQAVDPNQTTVPGPEWRPDPDGPPPTVGPPRGAGAGLDGLALARPGTSFGDYDLVEQLGSGGMGVVFKARHRRLNRVVALKMIKAGILADDRHIRLFRAEAEAVAALDHPHIVPVLESGEQHGVLYYSMKLVEGQDLGRALCRFKDRPPAIARLMARTAEAIAHAHQRGVLHRDIKPSNIIVDAHEDPHVIDFGLAMRLDAASIETTTGSPVGTPSFMSPEQVRGHRNDITMATDVYGLGAVLYALLTGQPPFPGTSAAEILRRVIDHDPPLPRNAVPEVDRDLETICLKCLGKESRARYPSARELADDLNRWLDGRPILARPASRVERAVKWVRRRKLIAALTAAAVIGGLVGVSGLAWGWSAAVVARDEARKDEDFARHHDYAASMNLAERDWRDANVSQMLRRLGETRPRRGKSDLRGFEWRYLDRLARAQAQILAGHAFTVFGVAYSRDGQRLVSASLDGTVKLWDARTRQLVRTLAAPAIVYTVAFHPEGAQLASAGYDKVVTIWDAATGQAIRTIAGHTARINELKYSADGRVLATTSHDGTIKLWDGGDGKLLHTLGDHLADQYVSLAFSPDGKTLAASGGAPTVRMWEVATGRRLRTIEDGVIPTGARVAGQRRTFRGFEKPVAFSPDGRILASGADDGTIRFRDAAGERLLHTLRDTHNLDAVTSLAFSPDGKTIASASYFDQAVRLWDVPTGYLIRTIKVNTINLLDIAFAPDGIHLAAAGHDGNVRILDVTLDQEARLLPEDNTTWSLAFGPDGTFLATGLSDGTVTIRDLSDGRLVRKLSGHSRGVRDMAISPRGRLAASASDDQTVRLWDVASGNELHVLRGHDKPVMSVSFSPDGQTLASGSDDHSVKLWNVDGGREIRTLRGHPNGVEAVSMSPDGRLLASGDIDGFLMLWDVATGQRLRALRQKELPLCAIAWSPDGRRLAAGGRDAAITIWDVGTGREIGTLFGHADHVTRLAFAPDGRRLASSSGDRTVRIWDPVFGQEVLVLRGHTGPIWAMTFSADGARIASGGADQITRIWEAGSAEAARGAGDDRLKHSE